MNINLMTYLQVRVEGFHRLRGQIDPDRPLILLTDEFRLSRAHIFIEEAAEKAVALVGASEAVELFRQKVEELRVKRGGAPGDIPEIADACVDSSFVASGTLRAMGIGDLPLVDEVCDKNDAKVGGGVDSRGKFLKPPGWTPPRIAELIERQRRE